MINTQIKVSGYFYKYRAKIIAIYNTQLMISSPLQFEQPCDLKREMTRSVGAATRYLIRMRHFFTTEIIKPTELLSIFQKKQGNEFI